MHPSIRFAMRAALSALVLVALLTPGAQAQVGPHQHHLHSHAHDVGPAGRTCDLRWIDAMVQHHTGAVRMGEFVFDIGSPGGGIAGQGNLAGPGPGDQGDGPVA